MNIENKSINALQVEGRFRLFDGILGGHHDKGSSIPGVVPDVTVSAWPGAVT